MKQPTFILQTGTPVIIHRSLAKDATGGMMIKTEYLEARTAGATGKIVGVVGGHGGDVYWVQHDDGKKAAYCFDEFELYGPKRRERVLPPGTMVRMSAGVRKALRKNMSR